MCWLWAEVTCTDRVILLKGFFQAVGQQHMLLQFGMQWGCACSSAGSAWLLGQQAALKRAATVVQEVYMQLPLHSYIALLLLSRRPRQAVVQRINSTRPVTKCMTGHVCHL